LGPVDLRALHGGTWLIGWAGRADSKPAPLVVAPHRSWSQDMHCRIGGLDLCSVDQELGANHDTCLSLSNEQGRPHSSQGVGNLGFVEGENLGFPTNTLNLSWIFACVWCVEAILRGVKWYGCGGSEIFCRSPSDEACSYRDGFATSNPGMREERL
jgi:hypothetical protein